MRRKHYLYPALGIALGWFYLSYRPGPTHVWQALWAEDGRIFLGQSLSMGHRALWQPYGGYLHTIPRLIAWVGEALPLRLIPVLYGLSSTLIAAICIVLFSEGLRRWLKYPPTRMILILVLVASYGAADEIDGNLANLHSYIDLGLLGLALLRPITRRTVVAGAVAAFLFAMTDAIAFIPAVIALVDSYLRKDEPSRIRGWLISVSMTAGALIQVSVTLTSPRGVSSNPTPGILHLASRYILEVIGQGIAPTILGNVSRSGLLFDLVVVLAVAGAIILHRRPQNWPSRLVVGYGLFVLSVVYFVLSGVANHNIAIRYKDIPAMLVLTALIVLFAHERMFGDSFVVIIGVIILAELGSFATSPRLGAALDWQTALARAKTEQCPFTTGARIPVAPNSREDYRTAQWVVMVPCARLGAKPPA